LGKLSSAPSAVRREAVTSSRREELGVFLFLTVVLAPVLAVAIVGGYGFLVWMYQIVTGPPGAPLL
jgi:nitrate reductase NapE